MRVERIIICLLIICLGMCGIAEAADMGILIKDGDFESVINGFGITYSGRNDTSLPYIFMTNDTASSGFSSLQFVSSEDLPEKESVSPQSLGFAYQGIYNTDYISVEQFGFNKSCPTACKLIENKIAFLRISENDISWYIWRPVATPLSIVGCPIPTFRK